MRLVLFVLAFFALGTDACSQSSGCCRKRRPPPPVSCGGGCQPGYQCGAYGCAKRRALAGLTRRIDGVIVAEEEGEQAYTYLAEQRHGTDVGSLNVTGDRLVNPNFVFRTCCEARGLPDSCLRYCHFNTYTTEALEQMYHGNDRCPIDAANEIQYCAAQGLDHRKCCSENGVGQTLAGRKCLAFCDQRPNKFTPIDMTHLACVRVFEPMKRCFYDEIQRRALEKFGNRKLLVSPADQSREDF